MACIQIVFHFIKQLRDENTCELIEGLWKAFLAQIDKKDLEIHAYFSESSIYSLLQPPKWLQKSWDRPKIVLIVNKTHIDLMLPDQLGWIQQKVPEHTQFKASNAFYDLLALEAVQPSTRVLKF